MSDSCLLPTVDGEFLVGGGQGFKSLSHNLAKYLVHSQCSVPAFENITGGEPRGGLGEGKRAVISQTVVPLRKCRQCPEQRAGSPPPCGPGECCVNAIGGANLTPLGLGLGTRALPAWRLLCSPQTEDSGNT